MATKSKCSQIGKILARAAIALGAACGAAALLGGLGYRFGLLPLGAGLQAVRWSATLAAIGAAIAVLAAILLLAGGVRHGVAIAAAALAINVIVAGPPLYLYQQAQHLPPIHDVSTDTAHPPAFVAVVPLRVGARNPVDYPADTAARQKAGYPDIVPLRLDLPAAQAFARAERAARAMGWQVVDVAPQDLRIEATDTTLLFGFKDDIVIRITAQGPRSVVDVRSLSRVGSSDLGTNARRIRAFLRALASN
jgi:uncharacterized protein (DUF1499 family)